MNLLLLFAFVVSLPSIFGQNPKWDDCLRRNPPQKSRSLDQRSLISIFETFETSSSNDDTRSFDINDYITITEDDMENAETHDDIPFWPEETFFRTDIPGVVEGDIVRPPRNIISTQAAIFMERDKWPGGRIPYVIGKEFVNHTNLILDAMKEFHKHTCIRFVPKTNQDKQYIRIVREVQQGCNSHVGRIQPDPKRGGQRVNFGKNCLHKGVIMHELLHAVGFGHEMGRFDRDNYICIEWQNIEPKFRSAYAIAGGKHGVPRRRNIFNYDYDSIMHYSDTAFSSNGNVTIITKDASKQKTIGRKKGFSPNDIKKINKLYGCK